MTNHTQLLTVTLVLISLVRKENPQHLMSCLPWSQGVLVTSVRRYTQSYSTGSESSCRELGDAPRERGTASRPRTY